MNILYVGQDTETRPHTFCFNFRHTLEKAGHHVKYIILSNYIYKFYGFDKKQTDPIISRIVPFKMSNLPKGFDIIFVEGIVQYLSLIHI